MERRQAIIGRWADGTGMSSAGVLLTLLPLLLAWTSAAADDRNAGLRFDLPPGVEWVQVEDRIPDTRGRRVWIAAGTTVDTTPWRIEEKRVDVENNTLPTDLVEQAFGSAAANCSDVKTSGPETIDTQGLATAWGRVICAHHRDKDYGSFTDHRVVVHGSVAFMLTSEVRTPPSPMAGALAFGNDAPDRRAAEFFDRLQASDTMTKDSVRICLDGACDPSR